MPPHPPDSPADDDPMSLDFTVPGAFPEAPSARAPAAKLEQAQRLMAQGKRDEACRLLEAAVSAGEDFGAEEEHAWRVLLDLYQATGQRDAFETTALAFARRFEKSPPAWSDGASAGPAAHAADKMVSASLSGTLNARVEGPLQQILKICGKAPVRVDVSHIADVDDRGCELLLAALANCRRIRAQCLLTGAGHLADILAAKMQPEQRAGAHVWLLLLELYQRLGREAAFEDTAVAYAVAFEVSPPSWEPERVGHCEN